MRFKETSLKVTFYDGVRDFRPYVSAVKIQGNHLEMILMDEAYGLMVHLHYEVYEEEDIIKKWRVLENCGQEMAKVERIYSAEFGLPGTGYEAMNYNGRWSAEFQAVSEPITCGKKVYESLFGLTAHGVNPCFIVHKGAEETTGEVWYGALGYSGNFKSVIEAVNGGFLNILIGISDTDFMWKLQPGECFETPPVYAGYGQDGWEGMSHRMHAFSLKQLAPKAFAEKALPVLYNSWYATIFDVNEEEQIALAQKAAKMGVELFVVDDGWFAGRKNDKAGLGDWFVDREKFPEGLQTLIAAVKKLGMQFGLWIEPEMVNPDSQLYRSHPDWIYRYESREVLMGRNQYLLDMSCTAVVDYLTDCFDRLLSENDIAYIKWDMNRYASEMGSQNLPRSEWKSLWYRNTQGIYTLIKRLKERHPNVEFEACASGGGRVDFGALQWFDEFWPSDNTDALDRLFMQENYSYLYPVKYMRAWVTDDYGMDERKIPLAFSIHAAMCGSLGLGIDLNKTSDSQLAEIGSYVEKYKEIRDIVQFGKIYRLQSLKQGDLQCIQYFKGDKSVVFLFQDHERYGKRDFFVKLRGLKADCVYEYEMNQKKEMKSGAFLMERGLHIKLHGDYDSMLIILQENHQR